ncbi:MAG: SCP2 sterol-binding domain-containing protein [Lautropia sp.]|nr:SCP2 sterol-binding domain-containing protein [Lautropia sp.]
MNTFDMPTLPDSFTLPQPVGTVLSRLPAYPGSVLLVATINLTLARQLPEDVKAALTGKRMAIRVRDAGVAFDFSWNGQRFVPSAPQADTDLVIIANAQDFILLAQRQQDPDTLFFNRRLVMEGDTELGLIVKNTLDALEFPVFEPAQWTPRAVVSRWSPQLGQWLPDELPKPPAVLARIFSARHPG